MAEDDINNQATSDPSYIEQSALYDQQQTQDTATANQQKTGITQSYAQSRQASINSYQDALDQINFGMRQVGIKTRAGSASRGLYDASGELSGIGQGVASTAIEPLVRQTRVAGERQAQTMANLNTNEQQALAGVDAAIAGLGLKTSQQKLNLKNSIIKAIQDAKIASDKATTDAAQQNFDNTLATDKYNADLAEKDRNYALNVAKEEANQLKDQASIPGTRANQLKVRADEQAKGRLYIGDPKLLGQLTKQGKHVIKVGTDYFQLSAKEEIDIQKKGIDIQKSMADIKKTLSDSGTGKDKPLTVNEAKLFGVPYGTLKSQVYGKLIPTTSIPQKDFNNFTASYQQRNNMSIGGTQAQSLYQDYQDTIDAIRSSENPLKTYNDIISKFPDLKGVVDAPKPISASELFSQWMYNSVSSQ